MDDSVDFSAPLVEKYRPRDIKDVVGNIDAVQRLEVIAKEGNMPNLILSVCAVDRDQNADNAEGTSWNW